MIVSGKSVLLDAQLRGYACGAFNFNNMEFLQAIIQAAEEEQSPVIVQTSEGAIRYAGIDYLSAMFKVAASKASVPVVLNLDHGLKYETTMNCLRHGWTNVMIDGSSKPIEENIALIKSVCAPAHAVGVSVEAELGKLVGIEDDVQVDEKDAVYTNPAEAAYLVENSGVDSLAVAIGTAHGKYKGEPKLDFDRLAEIRKAVSVPLVLHGASGVSEEQIKKAISLGICKINIDTDLRVANTEGIKKVFAEDPEQFDPRNYCGPARAAIVEVVKKKMRLFGSSGKAAGFKAE